VNAKTKPAYIFLSGQAVVVPDGRVGLLSDGADRLPCSANSVKALYVQFGSGGPYERWQARELRHADLDDIRAGFMEGVGRTPGPFDDCSI
jgi:hypothetical protein